MQSQKKVLIEEAVGTWCGWCPLGVTMSDSLLMEHPDNVLISAIHINDIMETSDGYFESTGLVSLPTSNLDRTFINIDPEEWRSRVEEQLNQSPPANVEVTIESYDEVTREMNVKVCANFTAATTNVDFRIAAIMVEDGVTGSPPDFNQENFYSAGILDDLGGWENKPAMVNAEFMVFDHVNRGLLLEYNGTENSIPSSPIVSEDYCESITVILSDTINYEYLRVYGMIVDNLDGHIVNANNSDYITSGKNAIPFFHSPDHHVVPLGTSVSIDVLVHDPDNKNLSISASSNLPSWLSLVPSLENDALLTGSPTSEGNHLIVLEVTDGAITTTQELTLEIVSNISSWTQIGEEFVSEEESETRIFSTVSENGVDIYSMGLSRNDEAFVYHYNGTDWTKVGENSVAQSLHGAISIDPISGNPWKFHNEFNRSKVFEYDGSNWIERGEDLSINSYHDISFTQDGSVYASGNKSGKVEFYQLENENWNELDPPIADNPLIKSVAITSKEDEVLILCSEFINGDGYSKVYSYKNGEWFGSDNLINPEKFTRANSNSYHAIASASNGNIFVAVDHEEGLYIYEWDGSQWTIIAEAIDGGTSREFDIAINEMDELFVTFLSPYCKAICQKWDGEEWTPQGIPEFTKNVLDVSSIVLENKHPGVVYIDNYESLGKIGAKRFEETISSTYDLLTEVLDIIAYPNPTTGDMVLKSALYNGQRYFIYNDLGVLVSQGQVRDRKIESKHLSQGHYLVKFNNTREGFQFVKAN